MAIKAAQVESRQARLDGNFQVGLRACDGLSAAEAAVDVEAEAEVEPETETEDAAIEAVGQGKYCAKPAESSFTATAPVRPPIRAASLRYARFNGRRQQSPSKLVIASSVATATAAAAVEPASHDSDPQQPSVRQTSGKQLHRQPVWPTSLISSLVSSRSKLNSSKAVPITRSGVHQSIRLHRNSLLAEQKAATGERQQVNNCRTTSSSNNNTNSSSNNNNKRTAFSSNATTSLLTNGGPPRFIKTSPASSTSSSTANPPTSRLTLSQVRAKAGALGRPICASAATTNSRVRQAALYARRQYHITPKQVTSQVAANLTEPSTYTKVAQQVASHASCSPLRLSVAKAAAAATTTTTIAAPATATSTQSSRLTTTVRPARLYRLSAPLATNSTTTSKSSLALNFAVHRGSQRQLNRTPATTTTREHFNKTPLKSLSKFSLTSSTSSLTLTAVKRVKPSESPANQNQQVNNNKAACGEHKTRSGHLGGSSTLSSSSSSSSSSSCSSSRVSRENHARLYLSARRGLSGNTLAAANRKPTTRTANRNAASNGICASNVNKSSSIISATDKIIIAENSNQTDVFARGDNVLLATTTSADDNNFSQPISTLISDRLTSANATAKAKDTPNATPETHSFSINENNKSQSQNLTSIDPLLLPDIPLDKPRIGGTSSNEVSGFCFNNKGSFAEPENRQPLDEINSISADKANHLVDYKSVNKSNNTNNMVDSQQDKQSALNAVDAINKSNLALANSNSTQLIKSPLGLHLSNNIGKTHKLDFNSTTATATTLDDKSFIDENGFAVAITNNYDQVENLPPHDDNPRCQSNIHLHGEESVDQQASIKELRLESGPNVVSDGQDVCCDTRSEAGSTDSRKAMDCQEEEEEEIEETRKQEVKSDDELLSSSISMQRTNSLDSNLETTDEQMVLGSPLVTPPPSELDVDEPETINNNNIDNDSLVAGDVNTKINSTKPSKGSSESNKFQSSSIVPVAELSIPIRTEPISDYYDLEPRPFARGKFAQVKRCVHKASQKCFAAKCIKKRRRLIDIRHEILLEIEALKLSYYTNHIVKLYEVYETSTEMILVLEMANGGELQRVLDDEEAIDEKQVKRMVKQILEGLTHLHDNDIAHLDIKPQNLLLTESFPNGEVKLCDFGISRRITKDCEIREICGTPDYVAPEILRYDPISLATDIWSLGVLTYVLLSGYSPFGSENKQQTFCNITQAALDFPSEIFDKISKEAIDFMQKLIVREPSKRLTSRQARNHSWLNQ